MIELDKKPVVKKAAAITGIGTANPLGLTVKDTRDKLLLGISGITENPYPESYGIKSQIAGFVKDFDPKRVTIRNRTNRVSRSALLGLDATDQAIRDAGFPNGRFEGVDPYQIGSYIGTGIGGAVHLLNIGKMFDNVEEGSKLTKSERLHRSDVYSAFLTGIESDAAIPASIFGAKGPTSTLSTACASSLTAMINAVRIIQNGDAKIMIAGGSESAISPEIIAGFAGLKAMSVNYNSPESASRPFDKGANGFVIAEGATVFILEDYEYAKERGAHIRAVIPGYGEVWGQGTNEASPDLNAEITTMRNALAQGRMLPNQVDIIHPHLTSTKGGDEVEGMAMSEVFSDLDKRPLLAVTKSLTGHMIGAAGAFGVMVICDAFGTGYVPYNPNLTDPIRDDFRLNTVKYADQVKTNFETGLVVAFGFHGYNTGLVLCTEDYYLNNYSQAA